jgi:hypothetical protein
MSEYFGGYYGAVVQVEQVRLGIPTEQPSTNKLIGATKHVTLPYFDLLF